MGKYIPLEEVSANLIPRYSSSALLQFHVMSRCDSTLFTDLWTFKEDCVDGFTEHFDLLSSVGEDVLDADAIASAKKFACQLYKTSENSFDLACVVLLDNISSPEKLPPTSDAFKQHVERRHYQTAVWGQARIQKPVLPNPETNWTLAEDLLIPVVMTLDPIPKACLQMNSYRCTTGCATLRC